MKQEDWLKYGVIALAAVGFGALLFFALSNRGGDLEGRTWSVSELTSDGNTVAPLEGTELTALFEDGTVSGAAGCNTYFASYTTDGDTIEIGPAGSTLIFCEEPAGAMDQEQAYLALLQSADSFEVDGDTLTLSSGGSASLVFSEGEPSGS